MSVGGKLTCTFNCARISHVPLIAQVGSFQDLQKGEVADELEADENLGRGFSDTRYVI